MTRLTMQAKNDDTLIKLRSEIRKLKPRVIVKPNETCFAGDGVMTKEQMSSQMRKIETIYKQKGW